MPQITILAYDGRSVGRVYLAVGLRLAVPLTFSRVVAIFKRKQYVENIFFLKWLLGFFFSVSSTDFYFHIQCDRINCYNIEPKIWWSCRWLSSPVLSLKLFNLLNRFSQILRVSVLNNSTFVKFSLSPLPTLEKKYLLLFFLVIYLLRVYIKFP